MENKMIIRNIKKEELSLCLDLIHRSFKTVAEQFGFTRDNCPGHNSFMPLEKLERFWDWGFKMYGLFEEASEEEDKDSNVGVAQLNYEDNTGEKLIGYFSLSHHLERENVIVLHNLCVAPESRGKGYGNLLLDAAKEEAVKLGGKILFLDFIDMHTELKNWYLSKGFVYKGKDSYPNLPFEVGKADFCL